MGTSTCRVDQCLSRLIFPRHLRHASTAPFSPDGCDVGGMPRAVLKKTTWGVGQRPQALWPRPHGSKPGWWPILPKVHSSVGILLALNGGAHPGTPLKKKRGVPIGELRFSNATEAIHDSFRKGRRSVQTVGENSIRCFRSDSLVRMLLSRNRVRWI